MMGTSYKEAALVASALLLHLWAGCAPELPPAWRIAADPSAADGQPDPRGKLRLLGIQAEPPELAPGEAAALSALVVTHPQQGQLQGGLPSPWPRGLSWLWLACRPAEGLTTAEPCGLAEPGSVRELRELGEGETALLLAAPDGPEGTLLVTLVAAIGDGPRACLARAQSGGGFVADRNGCVVGTKRVKVSRAGPRNRNPVLAALRLEAVEGAGGGDLLGPDARYGASPLTLIAERDPSAAEPEPDPDDPRRQRDEWLTAALFVTAGTLEAGRGGFLDPECAVDCAQVLTTSSRWDPPTAERAPLEAPSGVAYFFVVLRDDRGGLSWRTGRALLGL